jgi:hypothetical protein
MRRLARALGGGGLVLACVAASPGTARAQAPTQQGWWTASNPGSAQGLPEPPAPPDVPADGLLIEGGNGSAQGAQNAGPNAYAALVYQLAPGSSVGKLVLSVAPLSATTPGTMLQLCALKNSVFFPRQGGPIAQGPEFDCSRNVTAQPSADGSSYSFDVSGLVVDDALAVAVLPTSVTDRVVLSAPGASSLAVQQAAGGTTYDDDPAPGPSFGSAAAALPPAGSSLDGAGTALPPSVTRLDPTVASTVTQGAAQGSGAQQQAAPTQLSAAGRSTEGASPILVAALLAAACVGWALWTAAGRAAVRRCIPE